MPTRLKRFQHAGMLHFITFSCYHRLPFLAHAAARDIFVNTLEQVRHWYGLSVLGYVVMPEHVHLLVTEPDRKDLSIALQMLKQVSARRIREHWVAHPSGFSRRMGNENPRFWQRRYYDFNVSSERKRVEKLRYMHRNPVKRGLVLSPEEWLWSSFRHYASGIEGSVEIESAWTIARRKERQL